MKNVSNYCTNNIKYEFKVDVVIPTLGEPTLDLSLKAIEKNMNINKIILVGSEDLLTRYKGRKNILVVVSNVKNVGKKRALGLKHVKTKYYASIDSDSIITKEWFNWCMQTIVKVDVAACEGFGLCLNSARSRILIHAIRRHGKDFQGLGNAMLKTDIIRKVGMPEKKYMEDMELVRRIRSIGYKWILNPNIITHHLVTDIAYWRHMSRWGEIAGSEALQPNIWLRNLGGSLTTMPFNYKFNDCLYFLAGEIFLFFGYFKGKCMKIINIFIRKKIR